LGRPRVLAGLGARAGLLAALVVVGLVPFYLSAGPRCLGFLAYHRARPVEIGSPYASLALALEPLGQPVTVSYSYGSVNVHSPVTPTPVPPSPRLAGRVPPRAPLLPP